MDNDAVGSFIVTIFCVFVVIFFIMGIYCLTTGDYEPGDFPLIIAITCLSGLGTLCLCLAFLWALVIRLRKR